MNTLYDPEVWLPIPGARYEASTHGRVRSCPRLVVDTIGRRINRRGVTLVPFNSGRDYQLVTIHDKTWLVHRAIASAFHPAVEGKSCVNHKDGVKWNNRPENLEWVTYSENTIHSYEVLKRGPRALKGSKNPLSIRVCSIDKDGVRTFYGSISEAVRSGYRLPEIRRCLRNPAFIHYGMHWALA